MPVTLDRVLLDSAVFVYAVGIEHRYRDACRRLLQVVEADRCRGEVSALAVEETLHQRAGRTGDRESAGRVASNILVLCAVHDLTRAELAVGLRLFANSTRLNARDALHAATALNHGKLRRSSARTRLSTTFLRSTGSTRSKPPSSSDGPEPSGPSPF